MAESEAQKSLWKRAVSNPEFRSRREKVSYYTYMLGVGLLIPVPVVVFQPFDTFLPNLLVLLGVPVVQFGGWVVWVAWGRRRFPLPKPGPSLGSFIR